MLHCHSENNFGGLLVVGHPNCFRKCHQVYISNTFGLLNGANFVGDKSKKINIFAFKGANCVLEEPLKNTVNIGFYDYG